MHPSDVWQRHITRGFIWFFLSLSALALMSQPGAAHDELTFHAPSIWCAHGVREPYCSELADLNGNILKARTNLNVVPCKVVSTQPFVCPQNSQTWNGTYANNGLYPTGFYWVVGNFLLPSPTASIVLTRSVVAASVALILALSMRCLTRRYQLVLFLVMLTGFSNTGLFLFSSLNPSSWAAIGTFTGWLTLHAALNETGLPREKRWKLLAVSFVAYLMAIGSRTDAVVMSTASLLLVLTPILLARRGVASLFAVGLGTASLTASALYFGSRSQLFISRTDVPSDESQTLIILRSLFDSPYLTLRSLISIPTDSFLQIPELAGIVALIVLGWFVIRTYSGTKTQFSGVLFLWALAASGIFLQDSLANNERTGNEGRYLFPILLVGLGWWYLNSPGDRAERIIGDLKPATKVATALFVVTAFSVTERYVDKQSLIVRYVPESEDQWWWSWMPVGPNFLLFAGSIFFWLSLQELRLAIGSPQPVVDD